MGMPEILISFQQKASAAIRTGSRGLVAVLLEDDTEEQFLNPYRRQRDIREQDWTKESLTALKLVLKGSRRKFWQCGCLRKTERQI